MTMKTDQAQDAIAPALNKVSFKQPYPIFVNLWDPTPEPQLITLRDTTNVMDAMKNVAKHLSDKWKSDAFRGKFEKMVNPNGDITIHAKQATVASIVAARDLVMDVGGLSSAGKYTASASDLTREGAITSDAHNHLVAGGSLSFGTAVVIPTDVALADSNGTTNIPITQGSMFKVDANLIAQTMLARPTVDGIPWVLDFPAEGVTDFNVANIIAGAVPRWEPQTIAGSGLDPAMKQQLRELSMLPQDWTDKDWIMRQLVEGLVDPPQITLEEEQLKSFPPTNELTTDRLISVRVARALDAWDAVRFVEVSTGGQEKTHWVTHKTYSAKDRDASEIRASLAKALDAYCAANPTIEVNSIDAAALAQFIRSSRDFAEAQGHLGRAHAFFEALKNMGITDREVEAARERLMQNSRLILSSSRPNKMNERLYDELISNYASAPGQ